MKRHFPTITVEKNKIVEVTEILVTIPVYGDGDEIVCHTQNSEIIYLFIHQVAIKEGGMGMDKWDALLLKLFTEEKNIKPNDRLRFELWSFYGVSYLIKKQIECGPDAIKKFQFDQYEHLVEKKRGSTDYRYKEYLNLKSGTQYHFNKGYQL